MAWLEGSLLLLVSMKEGWVSRWRFRSCFEQQPRGVAQRRKFEPVEPNELPVEEHAQWWTKRGQHELRQILYWCWDPIGVNDAFPLTEDEYDRHVATVFGLAKRGASPEKVAGHLSSIEHEQMETPTTSDHRLAVACRVIEWYPQSLEHWAMHGST